MKAIAGATGILGSRIARELLSRGEQIRVLVRSDEAQKTWEALGAEVVYGDLSDPASLDALCSGADVVVTTATASARGGNSEVERTDVEGNQNLIDAAKRADVKRFVFVSISLADSVSPVPLLRAKGITEKSLQSSGLAWTIVAPHFYMESWIDMMVGIPVRGQLPVWIHGDGRRLHSFVSLSDVAAIAVAAVLNESAANRRLLIGGYPVSWREIVDACQELIDDPIEMRVLPPRSGVPHVSEPFGTTLGMISELLDAGDVIIESTPIYEEFGVTETPLRSFLITMLADRRRPFRDQPAIAPQTAADRGAEPTPTPQFIDPSDSAHDEKQGDNHG
ncbi:MAG: NAD(P)H-binding protein, partial [Thermoanaerobaculia bacterium]